MTLFLFLLSLFAQTKTDSYGIPLGELTGGMWKVWCWQSEDNQAAVFIGQNGEFCGVTIPTIKQAGILVPAGVTLRVDYDPPANGIRVYISGSDPAVNARFCCYGYDDYGNPLEECRETSVKCTDTRCGQAGLGPQLRAENHWTHCKATGEPYLWKYIVEYAE